MSIPQPFVQELLARIDLVDVVGQYVPLRKSGANFMGLCPFHNEKSPSFTVSPSKQFYHCFGCGANGDAIAFLTEHTGASFREAVQDLAQRCGLSVPEERTSATQQARDHAQRQQRRQLCAVLEKAAQAWQQELRQSESAVEYLKGRGLSGHIAKKFGLGYAPANWRGLAQVFANYEDPLLELSGLVIRNALDSAQQRRYDRFRDRIMFPIRNVKGECIGFGGRVLGDEKPKYLNSPETPVFSKGRELYGLFEARSAMREQGFALVTEGYMDVVALAQLGFPNAVATLGTACTPEHLQKLLRFTDQVVFSFDGDKAGRMAARRALDAALPHASDTRSIKFLFLPSEHDPDSFIRSFGGDAFSRLIGQATPLSRFLLDVVRESCDLSTAEGRALMATHARPLWQALPVGLLKRQLLTELAQLAQLDAQELGAIWHTEAPASSAHATHTRHAKAPAHVHASTPDMGATPQGQGGAQSAHPSEATARHSQATFAASAPFKGQRPSRRPHRTAAELTRVDLIARLLLSDMSAMETLSHQERDMLCHQPGAHGELFRWMERVWNEQGALPLSMLSQDLMQPSFQELAQRLLRQLQEHNEHTDMRIQQALEIKYPEEPLQQLQENPSVFVQRQKQFEQERAQMLQQLRATQQLEHYHSVRFELRTLLLMMRQESLKMQKSMLSHHAATDPRVLQAYKELDKELVHINQQLQFGQKTMKSTGKS